MKIVKRLKTFIGRNLPWIVRTYGRIRMFAYPLYTCPAQFLINSQITKLSKKSTIKVAFLVAFDTCFHFRKLFDLMLMDSAFDPWLIIIPVMNHGEENMNKFFVQTYDYFTRIYGKRVLKAWNGLTFTDVANSYDLFILLNSYDGLTHPYYGIKHLALRRKPVILSNYGYDAGSKYADAYCAMRELGLVWRYYAGTSWLKELRDRHQMSLRLYNRVVISGVPKMDTMAECVLRLTQRKRVLLCPHHSIKGCKVMSLSNFIEYKDLFQKLPTMYPDIDWVFRPHPLLSSALCEYAGWSMDAWNDWVCDFCARPNASYLPGGDCFDLFVNSDAMIQDCSSFLAEYHCTGHPQCYLLKRKEQVEEQFMDWGQELLSYAYQAFTQKEIMHFIDDVVVAGNDVMAERRKKFVNEKMLYNYPHVNEWILDDIKNGIWCKNDVLVRVGHINRACAIS